MAKKIKVIIKAPGAKPYGTAIDPTEENIKKRIGGDFRVFRFAGDGCVICAKKENGLDYNCEWSGRDFYGPMIWIGYSEKGFTPFPEDFNIFKKINYSLFEAFESGKKASDRGILDSLLLCLLMGAWSFIGFEFCRQIIELL